VPALLPPGRNNQYSYRMDPVPAVGEHTAAILQELQLPPDARAAVHKASGI
jgi:crotonobetainyl-CoA:carnitine CoA-transferase CaiB-like acyl-CoA transferase